VINGFHNNNKVKLTGKLSCVSYFIATSCVTSALSFISQVSNLSNYYFGCRRPAFGCRRQWFAYRLLVFACRRLAFAYRRLAVGCRLLVFAYRLLTFAYRRLAVGCRLLWLGCSRFIVTFSKSWLNYSLSNFENYKNNLRYNSFSLIPVTVSNNVLNNLI